MIRRNLTRRLEELEARIAPAAEPMIFQIIYVSPNGSEEDGPRFTIPSGGRQTGSTWLAGGGRCGSAGRPYREGQDRAGEPS
jgi:hypothetical protein